MTRTPQTAFRRWGRVGTTTVVGAVALSLLGTAPAGATGPTAAGTPPAGRAAAAGADLLGDRWGDDDTGEGTKASKATGRWDAKGDNGSTYSIAKALGFHDVWATSDPRDGRRKLTGHGVGIAVLDTGVAPVEGLLTPGKLVDGPDLSFESQAAGTRYLDGYGHGTHMAAIAAGRDSAVKPGHEADAKHFVGMAPDARIISVKVGTADGGADVSQVIAGIDWVVANKASHNIRVLNLSYGTDSVQSPVTDPLAHAVENAWRAGIVVVAAAGNDGETPGEQRLTMPAVDPWVIAAGSSDHRGTSSPKDDVVGAWTNEGTAQRRPDVVTPGKSVVSLRVPGSYADRGHPEGLVDGDTSARFFRGTGTSQSTAVVSGAAALLLQRNPELTPDQVKGLLRASARPLAAGSAAQGAGQLDVERAVKLLEKGPVASFRQRFSTSTGLGSLDMSRGGSYVVDPVSGDALRGEQDIFGQRWDPATWAPASAQRRSWRGGEWNGSVWAGSSWTSSQWPAANWSRRSWRGADWSDYAWSSMDFSRRSWRGDDWLMRSWSADSFSRRSWRGDSWGVSPTW